MLKYLDVAVIIGTSVLALLKVTAWGRAQKSALDVLTKCIELLDEKAVKRAVARRSGKISKAAKQAIHLSIKRAENEKIF